MVPPVCIEPKLPVYVDTRLFRAAWPNSWQALGPDHEKDCLHSAASFFPKVIENKTGAHLGQLPVHTWASFFALLHPSRLFHLFRGLPPNNKSTKQMAPILLLPFFGVCALLPRAIGAKFGQGPRLVLGAAHEELHLAMSSRQLLLGTEASRDQLPARVHEVEVRSWCRISVRWLHLCSGQPCNAATHPHPPTSVWEAFIGCELMFVP